MTPVEFNDMRDAYYRRRRRALELTATWVCVLVNHFPMRGKGAKTLRVEQLIGPDPKTLAQAMKERDAKMRRMK
jgi:hypothetical protein